LPCTNKQPPRERNRDPPQNVRDLFDLSQLRILIPSYRSHCNSSTLLFLFVTLQHRDARALLALHPKHLVAPAFSRAAFASCRLPPSPLNLALHRGESWETDRLRCLIALPLGFWAGVLHFPFSSVVGEDRFHSDTHLSATGD
jgi:hypothetical protein